MSYTRSTTIPSFTVLQRQQRARTFRTKSYQRALCGKKSTNEVGSGKKSTAKREKPNKRMAAEVGQSNLIGDALKKDHF